MIAHQRGATPARFPPASGKPGGKRTLPAWFPAWYVIEHPAASNDFDYVDPPTSPARAAQLLASIIELERQADWKRLIVLREQLRALNSDVFSVYMTRRAVRYSR